MCVFKVKGTFYLGPRSFTYENLKLLLSETACLFFTKYCMEMKIYEHGAGHMTKMAFTSIYG